MIEDGQDGSDFVLAEPSGSVRDDRRFATQQLHDPHRVDDLVKRETFIGMESTELSDDRDSRSPEETER